MKFCVLIFCVGVLLSFSIFLSYLLLKWGE
nr:MAG TPA: hypothetical protein [Inoviridae sp.]